jgi:hypothetical protein
MLHKFLEQNIEFMMKKGEVDYNTAFGRLLLGHLSEVLFHEYIMSELPGDEAESIQKYMEELKSYRISHVEYDDEYFIIHTARPGILIGVKGANIKRLESIIFEFSKKENFPFKGIKIKEDKDPLDEYIYKGYHNYCIGRFY